MEAHPLTMSLDNIDSDFRIKSSTHAFTILALLPKVKFPEVKDKKWNRTLRDRVLHACLRIVLEPLRVISEHGKQMTDAKGQLRMCYTILSMYQVDLPEATRLAGVTSRRSPVTIAKSTQLGDAFRHRRRWFRRTKSTIEELSLQYDPVAEMKKFSKAAAKRGLTGVVDLFWDGWKHCEPSVALTFDLLHSGHKYWKDHLFVWCAKAVGNSEIDKRYASLPQRIGYRHFNKGVTSLKKTGGRDHRDMQRYIMPVIDGAVPEQFAQLIHSHLDYFYISQCTELSEDDLSEIQDLLKEFHRLKDIVHAKNYRKTKGFTIPKLELQHNIVPTIMATGNLKGSSTDTTERTHIEFVKITYRLTNHRDVFPQMTDRLDLVERLRHFDLATALSLATEEEPTDGVPNTSDSHEAPKTIESLRGPKREDHTDYFAILRGLDRLHAVEKSRVRTRTFSVHPFTAIHLNRDPDISSISLSGASTQFGLEDLESALEDYYYEKENSNGNRHDRPVLQRRATSNTRRVSNVPFNRIRVWYNIKVQTMSLTEPGNTSRPQTICAEPKSAGRWPFGRHDCALFINDMEETFNGKANLQSKPFILPAPAIVQLRFIDHCTGQLRLIFQGITNNDRSNYHEASSYMVYAQRFDCVRSRGMIVNPSTGLIRLKRAKQRNGERLGAVVEATRIRSTISVLPFFGKETHGRYTSENSMDFSVQFNLNKYANKEDFCLLHNG